MLRRLSTGDYTLERFIPHCRVDRTQPRSAPILYGAAILYGKLRVCGRGT